MKFKLELAMVSGITTLQISAADFQNLNFDEPDLRYLTEVSYGFPPVTIQAGTTADLFPGWSVQVDERLYSGQVIFSQLNRNVPVLAPNFALPAFGYSVYFSPTIIGDPNGEYHILSLSQIGLIPAQASNLLTVGGGVLYINSVQQFSQPTDIQLPGHNVVNAWDVAHFAGKVVDLEFRVLDRFDVIGFNIPEPSEWALLWVGGGVLWWTGRNSVKGK